uniref:Uncharacterized protein n=1 Tax=Chenopodium quinoa TaxID=63459 RepID=A0A803M2N1_CHEQI
MNSSKPLDSIPPTDSVEITNGLTLTPRIKLRLTIHHADASVSPLDEWKLKRSLINFLKSSFSIPITIPEEDLIVRRFKDLKKRKREDAVAVASLFIRDLGFIVSAAEKIKGFDGGDGGLEEVLEKKFLEWRIVLVEKMDGMEVNLEGVKFRVSVNLPVSDDFEKMKKEWQEFYAFGPVLTGEETKVSSQIFSKEVEEIMKRIIRNVQRNLDKITNKACSPMKMKEEDYQAKLEDEIEKADNEEEEQVHPILEDDKGFVGGVTVGSSENLDGGFRGVKSSGRLGDFRDGFTGGGQGGFAGTSGGRLHECSGGFVCEYIGVRGFGGGLTTFEGDFTGGFCGARQNFTGGLYGWQHKLQWQNFREGRCRR